MTSIPRLYAIADATFGNPVDLARALFAGGARLVQLRNKNVSDRVLLAQVLEILAFSPADSCLMVNDRVDVARISGAGGVHLGQTDVPPEMARRILPSPRVVGLSTHSVQQALRAMSESVDYIAAGPVFPTSTKINAEPVIGLEGLREICSRASKPVVAIGGITLENARDAFACGAASVAVISDLLNSKDVAGRTQEWLRYNFEICERPSTSTS